MLEINPKIAITTALISVAGLHSTATSNPTCSQLVGKSIHINVLNRNVRGPGNDTNCLPLDQEAEPITVSDTIKLAQEILAVSKQHLANIFQISRQQIYAYLSEDADSINTKEKTQERATIILSALNVIRDITNSKLGASAITMKNGKGNSLIDELSFDEINLESVREIAVRFDGKMSRASSPSFPEEVTETEAFLETNNVA